MCLTRVMLMCKTTLSMARWLSATASSKSAIVFSKGKLRSKVKLRFRAWQRRTVLCSQLHWITLRKCLRVMPSPRLIADKSSSNKMEETIRPSKLRRIMTIKTQMRLSASLSRRKLTSKSRENSLTLKSLTKTSESSSQTNRSNH